MKKELAQIALTVGDWLYFWDCYSLVRSALSKAWPRVIVWHRVAEAWDCPWSLPAVRPGQFEKQIAYICCKCNPLALDQLVEYKLRQQPLPNRSVVVTFDDGYKDVYLNAYPILKKYNVPATIFLANRCMDSGSPLWWDEIGYLIYSTHNQAIKLDGVTYLLVSLNDRKRAISSIVSTAQGLSEEQKSLLIERLRTLCGIEIPNDLGRNLMLSWSEVEEMSDNGIDFGAHTVTHPIMSRISSEEARYEILQSRKTIEQRLNRPVTVFAYPRGQREDFTAETVRLVEDAGLKCAVTGISSAMGPKTRLYELGRTGPGSDVHTLKFLAFGPYSDFLSIYGKISAAVHN